MLLLLGVVLLYFYGTNRSGVGRKVVLGEKEASDIGSVSEPAKVSRTNEIRNDAVAMKEADERKERQLGLSYLTPISVFGKVVDDRGMPIAGANVEVAVADAPMQSPSRYSQSTDANGLFSLTGVHGLAFSLQASMGGYYSATESRAHRNVAVPGPGDAPDSSKERPTVLVLRKRGLAEPLITVESGQIEIPKGGQIKSIDLGIGESEGDALKVASWIGNTDVRPFDWRFQLSVPGGGLVERDGKFEFEAPLQGYSQFLEVSMASTAERWTSSVEKEYFIKLRNERYARILIRFYPGKRNFVVTKSYVNPKPGSRNLEYDSRVQSTDR